MDFTMPFMNTGISILFKKPTQKATSLFGFLSPFSTEVWTYVVGAYLGVSCVLFLVGRMSPYEWDNPHPCRQNDQVLENSFSLLNSMWFTIGSYQCHSYISTFPFTDRLSPIRSVSPSPSATKSSLIHTHTQTQTHKHSLTYSFSLFCFVLLDCNYGYSSPSTATFTKPKSRPLSR